MLRSPPLPPGAGNEPIRELSLIPPRFVSGGKLTLRAGSASNDHALSNTHWRFHAREFIRAFRKCAWLIANELARCIPRTSLSGNVTWAQAYQRAGERAASINLLFRKYCGFLEETILLVLLFSLPVRADVGTDEPGERLMGQCFADAQEVIRIVFGPSGLEDENIKVRPVPSLKDGSVWVVDTTSEHNHAWFLLQPNKDRQVCLTLFVPAASSVEIKQRGAAQSATAKTQASPGYPMKQATYHRRKEEKIFSFDAASCQEIQYTPKGKSSRRKVQCSNRFYYDD